MKRVSLALTGALVLVVTACGGEKKDSLSAINRRPVSVRGWVEDVEGAKRESIADLEIARRAQQFGSTSLWVEGSQYSSGGISENGAFVILDVPPNDVTIGFQAPGADGAQLVLQNIPSTADVLIPRIMLRNGGVRIIDPKAIKVRVPSQDATARPTGQYATVAGHRVPVIATPYRELLDRRDYPDPGGMRPVATVK